VRGRQEIKGEELGSWEGYEGNGSLRWLGVWNDRNGLNEREH